MNDTLRHLFDRCPNRFCVIIALTADVTELQTMFFDYVLSRIVRQIELPLLGQDEAVEFVGEILEYSRINPEGDRGYFPFERVAVENVAARIPEITPRKIVNAMHEVIEGARLADHDPEQGPVSLQFLDENDIVEESATRVREHTMATDLCPGGPPSRWRMPNRGVRPGSSKARLR